ncbi:MAG: hypothetical protein P4L85_28845 [Paludisphaera borealis]|uniref:hypothetical protein n=1 Tax=Paludisphaera borealis TaxID=1387353 RepID=UPI00284A07E5|nr:hypothetical protein [Paludisphaera borealis]MDR3623375.1 hypothetical protein [Paludisphaera borealis]
MCSGNRFSAIAPRLTFLGLILVAGCNPHKDQLRPEGLFGRIGNKGGEVIEAKRCVLRVVILNRPFRDPVINEVVWKAADEQAIAPEERLALQANGLRIGRITGDLPSELEAVIHAPPPNKVDPAIFQIDEEQPANIIVCDTVDQVSLLLNRDHHAFGKDYKTASGYFRVTPRHHESNSVAMRITPEIHHGPIQQTFQPLQATPYSPQDFKIANGQQEETLRDLAANLVLEAGQVAVLGCIPEQERSLGSFLFTLSDPHNDERRQRLVLVWALRNQVGVVDEKKSPLAWAFDRKLETAAKAAITPANDEVKK